MLTDAFLNRLDTLSLAMRGRAQGGAGGSRRSRQTGSSAEFSDYREYVPGDDIRRLDWNAYARFDKLFLKLFMEEQESLVTVLLDASASMGAKWASARSAAEAIGYLALTGGDRLNIQVLKNGRALRSSQLSGRAAFPRLTGFLDTCGPDGNEGTLTETVKHTEGLKKGLCFLITDGYTEDALKEALDYLRYLKQETAVIQVLSGEELRPDYAGAVRLTDSESGEKLDLLADRAALDAYQDALADFLKSVRENCAFREAPYMLLDSEKSFEESFIPLLSQSRMI
ncbi:MAG: DUF58 domain-containing protein [Clostridia bacterium]|nr:DUF58 domain-containing protein [Clostridia bacterium]